MARTASEKKTEAEAMFKRGEKLADIAAKLRVSEGTVRSWKAREKWGTSEAKPTKKNDKNVAKNVAINATKNATLTKNVAKTLQKNVAKKSRGGQPGNSNAKGGKGNPDPVRKEPPDRTSHGGYSNTYADLLTDEENELFENMKEDEELHLIEQIKLYTIRERRIMRAINFVMQRDDDFYATDHVSHKGGRDGNFSETQHKDKYLVAARLEQELSTIQGKKTKSISELAKLHLEQKKLENIAEADDETIDWVEAMIGGAAGE